MFAQVLLDQQLATIELSRPKHQIGAHINHFAGIDEKLKRLPPCGAFREVFARRRIGHLHGLANFFAHIHQMRRKSRLVTLAGNMVLPTIKPIAAKIRNEFRKRIMPGKSLFGHRMQLLQGKSGQFGAAGMLSIHAS